MAITSIQNIKRFTISATSKPREYKVVINPLGKRGYRGYSAYEIALQNGFIGSEQEWIASLEGKSQDLSVLGDYERDWTQDFLIAFNT